ncbi:MAG: type II toxin-antitoxin system VapC family toxin [Solirubrobacterales bacterium]|nr:type II toxin-antitoxin system VapC family toxin [Solirubrobacterales bacterium]
MKLLLDVHTVLWFTQADARLSANAHSAIVEPANTVLLSAVVPWEIAIKRALGKLDAGDDYLQVLTEAGATELPVTIAHAQAVERLPRHHGDPFDRLLVAQAQVEDATILTGDPRIHQYAVATLW